MNAWLRTLWPKRSPKKPRFRSARPQLESLEDRQLLATFTVTNVDDSGPGSLRQAITDANARAGKDTIVFSIPGAGAHTIAVGSTTHLELPSLTDPAGVVIKGPQPASSPVIELTGALAPSGSVGLRLRGGPGSVSGLAINSFGGAGIELAGAGGHSVEMNYLGTDVSGSLARGNSVGAYVNGSANNVIRGNLISGNGTGVRISGAGARGNKVSANRIGTNATGRGSLANQWGVLIDGGRDNLIGGSSAAGANLIAGNARAGVWVGSGSSWNYVVWNSIGLDASGIAALGNQDGVSIQGSPHNSVKDNTISGNVRYGVLISGTGATANAVSFNRVGTDPAGTRPWLGNEVGVSVHGAPGNTIHGNQVSGNRGNGVELLFSKATGNTVQYNLIGTKADGLSRLGNGGHGVYVGYGASNNQVGSRRDPGAVSNTIAYNGGDGVFVEEGIGNSILSNAVHGNSGRDIRLSTYWRGNNLQPPPTVSAAGSANNTISWSLAGFRPNTTYTVQFFEGPAYLGSATVTTDPFGNTGNQSFVSSLPLHWGHQITATATAPSGDTSEFSAPVLAT